MTTLHRPLLPLIFLLLATLMLCSPLATAAPAIAMPTSAASLSDDLPSDFSDALDASTREQVLRGRYVARLGDCVACHTQDKRKPMAGGLALETPFGKLYSTNITPDRQTGIGQYSFAQFDRVMREGVTADGRHLYPAMPYPSYAKMSEEDMRALYVYLMQAVTPLALPNRPLEMSFPFNQRWGMALWNMAFLQAGPFRPDPAQSAQWNRGAYIVQGPGHCGACHTPRGIGMQEKTMSESGSNGPLFLSGETVENWRALDLRGRWQPADVAGLLRTGSNRFGTVAGNMVDVVQHSTQYMSDEDLLAIGTYLANTRTRASARRRPPPHPSPLPSRPTSTSRAAGWVTCSSVPPVIVATATGCRGCSRRWRAIRPCKAMSPPR